MLQSIIISLVFLFPHHLHRRSHSKLYQLISNKSHKFNYNCRIVEGKERIVNSPLFIVTNHSSNKTVPVTSCCTYIRSPRYSNSIRQYLKTFSITLFHCKTRYPLLLFLRDTYLLNKKTTLPKYVASKQSLCIFASKLNPFEITSFFIAKKLKIVFYYYFRHAYPSINRIRYWISVTRIL